MNDLRHWTEIILASYTNLIDGVIFALPRILAGLMMLLLGWLLARLLSKLIARSLKVLRFDKLMDRMQVGTFLKRVKSDKTPSQIVAKFVYWIIMLMIFVGFSETLELSIVSQKIGMLINYIPNIIIAAFILIIGMYLANQFRTLVQTTLSSYGIRSGRVVGSILFYLVAIFVILTTLEQLKFNIDLLTSNVMILLGGVALAFAIGYGLAAKEIFPHIISSYYNKGTFHIGERIRISGTEGTIVELTNLSVVIETKEGRRYIPAKNLISEEVDKIMDS